MSLLPLLVACFMFQGNWKQYAVSFPVQQFLGQQNAVPRSSKCSSQVGKVQFPGRQRGDQGDQSEAKNC